MTLTRRQTLRLACLALAPLLPFPARAEVADSVPWAGQMESSGHIDGPGENASFFDPRGLARDPRDGSIIVADAANALIRRVDAQGVVSTLAGAPEQRDAVDGAAADARFNGPDAVAVAPDGTIYIADAYANTLRVLRGGQVSTLAGRVRDPGFKDGRGNQAQFNHPVGLAYDPRRRELIVADSYNHTVRVVDAAGRVRTLAGTPGVADHRDGPVRKALFNTPVGVAVGADGSIFVSEYFNHDVRRIDRHGRVSTVVGKADESGDADGRGAVARLNKPQQLCIAPDGDLIIADAGNRKLRRLDRHGDVATVVELTMAPYGVVPAPGGGFVYSAGEALWRAD